MIDQLRAFLAVIREGSINRAALRLRVSQPSVTRHIQALEQECGGLLFERGAWGARPTELGHAVEALFAPVVAGYDQAWEGAHRMAGGHRSRLRIGYLGSSANVYLTPALVELRKAFPDLALELRDLTPAEQISELRRGMLDVAFAGQEGRVLAGEFHSRRVATLRVVAAVSTDHRAARGRSVRLARLRGDLFVGATEEDVPGRNTWIQQLCRRAGFRPRLIASCHSIAETFAMVSGEGAVSLLPDYFGNQVPAGVRLIPVSDPWATWDFVVLRQRGKAPPPVLSLIDQLCKTGGG
ncbi:MAG: LysR family transcriptional regulator [Terrimicrobiaceae bacterium]|nr:LysR family transcriptional regulator [Terrimicrobiaceae bacterium]